MSMLTEYLGKGKEPATKPVAQKVLATDPKGMDMCCLAGSAMALTFAGGRPLRRPIGKGNPETGMREEQAPVEPVLRPPLDTATPYYGEGDSDEQAGPGPLEGGGESSPHWIEKLPLSTPDDQVKPPEVFHGA